MTSDKDAPAAPRARRDARAARRRLDFGAEPPPTELPSPRDEAAERLEARRRWNFDFENEVPLDGDWEWERIVVGSASTDEARQSLATEAKDAAPDDGNRRV